MLIKIEGSIGEPTETPPSLLREMRYFANFLDIWYDFGPDSRGMLLSGNLIFIRSAKGTMKG